MNAENVRTCALRYLVTVKDLVVAADISSTIEDLYPGAEVLQARSLKEAEELAGLRDGVAVAIMDAKVSELTGSGTGTLLRNCGAQILFLSERPTSADEADGSYLARPFTTETLVEALRSVEPRILPRHL